MKEANRLCAAGDGLMPAPNRPDPHLEDVRHRIAAWVNSPEGQAEIKATQERIDKACEEIKRASAIRWEDMMRPIGPVRR